MDEIAKLERHRFQAMVQVDTAALEEILADDLVYIHGRSARVVTKAQVIAELQSGEQRYWSIEVEDLTVRVYGSTAVVNGTNTMGTGPRGGERSFRIRFTDVYVRRNGRWQMVTWQASQIPQE